MLVLLINLSQTCKSQMASVCIAWASGAPALPVVASRCWHVLAAAIRCGAHAGGGGGGGGGGAGRGGGDGPMMRVPLSVACGPAAAGAPVALWGGAVLGLPAAGKSFLGAFACGRR